jgi:hypothetical protein
MARLTHEEKVERFYSHGADLRAAQEGGALSFGYWTESTVDYRQATEDLLARVLKEEAPRIAARCSMSLAATGWKRFASGRHFDRRGLSPSR